MTDKTADNLVYEVASLLGKRVVGEALAAEDYTTIQDCIDPVLEEIEDIVNINSDAIPARYFQTIARLIAVHAAPKFSNAPVDLARVQLHEQRLRQLSAVSPSYEPLKAEYY